MTVVYGLPVSAYFVWLQVLITVQMQWVPLSFLGISKWRRKKKKASSTREEQARDDDVMMLAACAGLDRGMEGQRDGGEDELLMRSSCWGEAGGKAGLQSSEAAVRQQLTDNNSEAW